MPRITTASSAAARGYGFTNAQPAAFTNYQIAKSLRCDANRGQYLIRQPGGSADGNRRIFTESLWFRQMSSNNGGDEAAGSWIGAVSYPGFGGNHGIYNYGNGTLATLCYYQLDTPTWQGFLYRLPFTRDIAAWYHLVWSVDTTQSIPDNRQKLYINGQLERNFKAYSTVGAFVNRSPTYPPLNQTTEFGNTSAALWINANNTGTANFDGYLAELHWVDGQALDASYFGFKDSNNEWQPKPYTGSYGKFGFYLPFIDESTDTSLGKDYSRALKPLLTYPQNSDEYFGAVSLLTQTVSSRSLSANNLVFKDYSSFNHPVTAYNNACQGSPSPFYSPGEKYDSNKHDGSLYLTGINDYLTIPFNPAFHLGNRNFTIECWVKTEGVNRLNSSSPVLNQSTGGAVDFNSAFFFGIGSNVGMYLSEGRGTWDQYVESSGRPISDGCWHHVAAVRNGDTLTLYIDGVNSGASNLPTNYTVAYSTRIIEVGTQANQVFFTGGLISNLRMTVGQALYTNNFNPPESPLTSNSNTVLLLKFKDAAIIDSTGEFVIFTDPFGKGTRVNPLCGKYTPGIEVHDSHLLIFNPGGKFLSIPGTDFTFETWYVCVSGTGDINVFNLPNRSLANYFALNYNPAIGRLTGYLNDGGTLISNNRDLSRWTHLAWARKGREVTLYINGSAVDVRDNNATLGYSFPAYMRIGSSGSNHRAFYDQLRFTQGIARYTSNFTPPSAVFPLEGSATFFQPINYRPSNINALTYNNRASFNESPTDLVYNTSNPIISSNNITTYILTRNSNLTVSNSGLTVATGGAAATHYAAAAKRTLSAGKYYWEVTAGTEAGSINIYGMIPLSAWYAPGIYVGGQLEGFGYGYSTGSGLAYAGLNWQLNIAQSNFSAIANGTVLGFAYDATTGNAWVRNSTGWLGGGDPNTGTIPAWTRAAGSQPLSPAVSLYNTTAASSTTFNFGSRPYTYTPPTNYSNVIDLTYDPGVRGTFCTINALGPRVGMQPTVTGYSAAGQFDGGMVAGNVGGSGSTMWIGGTFGMQTGKWYFEATYISTTVRADDAIGLKESSVQQNATNYWMNQTITDFYVLRGDGNKKTGSTSSILHRQGLQINDIVGVAYDADAGNLWFSVNGTFLASGDPVSGINAAFTTLDGLSTSKAYVPVFSCYGSGVANSRTWACNFGARPYAFRPPEGFNPLCTAVLPNTANTGFKLNQVNRAFNATEYMGGSTVFNVDPYGGCLELAAPLNGYEIPSFYLYDACNEISNGARPRKPLNNNNVILSANPVTSFLYTSAAFFNGSNANILYNNVAFSEFNMGASNFCVEGWVYPIEHRGPAGNSQTIVYTSNATDGNGLWFGIAAGTNNWYWLAGASGTWAFARDTGVLAVSGQWHHFAYVRENNQYRLYINGRLIDSVTGTTILTNADGVFAVGGRSANTQYFRGYIQDIRVYRGVVKYNTNFTPPSGISDRIISIENNSTPNKQIRNLPFQPDLTWIKSRGTQLTQPHGLHDVVRGAGNLLSTLYSNNSSNTVHYLSSFNIDGFTLRDTVSGNLAGQNFISWNWKAGDSTVENTNGSITTRVNVNKQTGLSIFSYIGNGTGSTIGHGLDRPPSFVLVKSLTALAGFSNNDWFVQHISLAANQILRFNTNVAVVTETAGTGSTWNVTKANSNVIVLGDQAAVNRNGTQYIGYAWAEVPGYSKFGSYVGNGSTDGPFVYCGFKPGFLIIRGTGTNYWVIKDSARTTSNGYDYELYNNRIDAAQTPSVSLIENTYYTTGTGPVIDFYSNGFKLRSTASESNALNSTYIYTAFAEVPYKFARGC